MENINMFPLHPGFLFPNGMHYSTNGKGHEKLAYELLKEKFNVTDQNKLSDPEYILQDEYSAILIRYRWQEKLLYLPKTAPKSIEGRELFLKAIKFYEGEGFKILNLYKISLACDYYYLVKEFFVEDFEFLRKDLVTGCVNYNTSIIKDKKGEYMYNPERIGD